MCVRRCVVTLGALATFAFGAGCSDDEAGGSTVSEVYEISAGATATYVEHLDTTAVVQVLA